MAIVIDYDTYDVYRQVGDYTLPSYWKKKNLETSRLQGSIYITPYGAFLGSIGKTIGRVVGGVAKGVGRVIHYTGKALGVVAPIAVPLIVGVGISALAGAAFGSTAAAASAETVAKAAIAGHFATAATHLAFYTGKVIATQLVSSTILNAIYKKPSGEVVIATHTRKPVLIIPAYVREIVTPPQALVSFITQNGRLRNSKAIQSRVDWLASKIQQTAKEIVKIYRNYRLNVTENDVVEHLQEIFFNIPSTKRAVERKIQDYLRNLSQSLCRQAVMRLYNEAISKIPELAAKKTLSYYERQCPKPVSYFENRIRYDALAAKREKEEEEKRRMEEIKRKMEEFIRRMKQEQRQGFIQQSPNMGDIVSFLQGETNIGGVRIKNMYLVGGMLLILLLTASKRRRETIIVAPPPYR